MDPTPRQLAVRPASGTVDLPPPEPCAWLRRHSAVKPDSTRPPSRRGGSQGRTEPLELVDMAQVVARAIALLALVVSVATYRLNIRDRRYAWKAQERAQAEEVAGWLAREMCQEHGEMEWKAYVRNSSKSPVYDVLYVIHDSQDLDAAMPEMIPLIPPDTAWDFFPTWFGNQPEGNRRMYMTFRDKRGKAWQRDTHGRLMPFRRNVDNAPPADPVSGRISYGTIQRSSRARISEVIIHRLIKRGTIIDISPEEEGQQPAGGSQTGQMPR